MQRVLALSDKIDRSWMGSRADTFCEDSFVFKNFREPDWQAERFHTLPEQAPKKVTISSVLDNPYKVGIGTWDFDAKATALHDLDKFDFSWYTNWRPEPLWSPTGEGLGDPRFVPMVWGKADLTATNIKSLKDTKSGYLLGFNEPDNPEQANLSVKEAIKLWPKLMKTGLELGSPACMTDQTMGKNSWLGKFMDQIEKKGYEVDFVAVHYYTENPSIAEFKKFLTDVYNEYGKPIWVTEWALVDWDNTDRFKVKEIAAFADAATRMLDDLSFVKRHAWFSAYDDGHGGDISTQLLDARGELTKVGDVFHDFLL
jgi:hypothetical protein